MNPYDIIYDPNEEVTKLTRQLELAKASLNKWESVFGHLGTPDEVGNEWVAMSDRLEAVEKERDDVVQQLVQSEIGKRKISEAHDALQVEVGKLKDLEVSRCVKINGYIVDNARLAEEVERLQAKITEMEKQHPICRIKDIRRAHYMTKVVGLDPEAWLYALPGAKGE